MGILLKYSLLAAM